MAGFDLARPLWEWTLAEGLDGGQAALVLKIHHSLTDGIGGMQLATTLFDLEPAALNREPMPDAPKPEYMSTSAMIADAFDYNFRRFYGLARKHATSAFGDARNTVRHPVDTAAQAVDTLRSIARTVRPVTDTRSSLMTARKLGWHYDVLEVSLADLKRAAGAAGGTLNDAFVGGVAGGLRRYHERHAANCEELRVTLPISIRHEDDPIGGNRITLMRFTVPVGIVDPVKRMRAVHELTGDARNEPSNSTHERDRRCPQRASPQARGRDAEARRLPCEQRSRPDDAAVHRPGPARALLSIRPDDRRRRERDVAVV